MKYVLRKPQIAIASNVVMFSAAIAIRAHWPWIAPCDELRAEKIVIRPRIVESSAVI